MTPLRISARGILHSGGIATFPSVTVLSDRRLLATYRTGSTKDSDDETVEYRFSSDRGDTWSAPTLFPTHPGGSLRVAYVTPLQDRLLAAALWIDRESYPGCGLFNAETEGCLPMRVLLSESRDGALTWTPWREVPTPAPIGPPSLTNPLLHLADGRLAMSIESNKHYLDGSPWRQFVTYLFSSDGGATWANPIRVIGDDSGRLFHWDQRAAVQPDGAIMTYSWVYDTQAKRYLDIRRIQSEDNGRTWRHVDTLPFRDQPSHPAILPGGRTVLAWVDRFESQSIRARLSPFDAASEVVLYEAAPARAATQGTGALLAEMAVWTYGLPYAEAISDSEVIIVFYAGDDHQMDIHWVRLSL